MVRADLAIGGTGTATPKVIARGALFADTARFPALKDVVVRHTTTSPARETANLVSDDHAAAHDGVATCRRGSPVRAAL